MSVQTDQAVVACAVMLVHVCRAVKPFWRNQVVICVASILASAAEAAGAVPAADVTVLSYAAECGGGAAAAAVLYVHIVWPQAHISASVSL
jgi:hypothetical protein